MDFNSARDCPLNRWVREMLMREAHFDAAYVVESLDLIGAEMRIQSAYVVFQLLKFTRA